MIPTIKIWKKCKKHLETHVYHKSRSYDVWFLRHKVQKTGLLSFWVIFCPLTLKNQNFEKTKEMARDVIILRLCTTNDNDMMYGS